ISSHGAKCRHPSSAAAAAGLDRAIACSKPVTPDLGRAFVITGPLQLLRDLAGFGCEVGHRRTGRATGIVCNQPRGGTSMFRRRDIVCCGTLAVLLLTAAQGAWAQEKKMNLFKIITVKDEIVIGLTADELKALGGDDAGAVAHALAQKGDMTVWQYNVHRGANGELQQAPTAKIGLIAHSSLRVEPYTTPYAIVPHQ